jgi:Stress responsive A/B Barrel Domain
MLTHIVIWKYRADTAQAVRAEHVARLRALSGVIPDIVSLSVGFDELHLPRSYDTGLVAVFRDRAGLDAYTEHPQHIEVANLGRTIAEHAASVDFESEG